MEMILLDWTRMGRYYCLAGAVDDGGWRMVRPLLYRFRNAPVRNVGWSPYLMDGHSRWEIFELIGEQAAPPEPPHLEDIWVRALRPKKQVASHVQRLAILQATQVMDGQPHFGVPLKGTRSAAYLEPGSGTSSLTTVIVPAEGIRFAGVRREGAPAADFRVTLRTHGLEGRWLSVKDHHLLLRAEDGSPDLEQQVRILNQTVRQMGEQVAVRFGLSRPFPGGTAPTQSYCWLMADGFYSVTDPQS